MNLIEKYLAKAAGLESVRVGQDIRCKIALAAAHDVTGPMALDQFKEIGVNKVFDPQKIMLVADHVYPAPTLNARRMQLALRQFHNEYGVRIFDRGEGVIHQLISEKCALEPGEIIVCADSHTCTAGGYGVIGIGVGSTELAAAMATGTIDLEVPEVIQINLTGRWRPGVFGKDLILTLALRFGIDGLTDRALLLTGSGIENIPLEERMTVCNMGIELGAMITLFGTDQTEPDVLETITIPLETLEPMAACPYSPANVKTVSSLNGTAITQVVVGSCTNGRLGDMEQVFQILKGKKIAAHVNMLVIPASAAVLEEMENRGYTKEIRKAGAVVTSPGCGPCYGGHMGLASEQDVVVATTNRNFHGRMGDINAQIYLTSPATAAASALAGQITVQEAFHEHDQR